MLKRNVVEVFSRFLIVTIFWATTFDTIRADDRGNGIHVSKPLLFSEKALERMLEASRSQLEEADPEFAKSRENIGAVQGLRSSTRARALDFSYKPILSVLESIKETEVFDESGNRSQSSSKERTSTRTDPSQEINIPTVNITNVAGSIDGDGGLKLSALDNLAERAALFYRFVNFRYLFTQSSSQIVDKRSVLIGFDISIEPEVANRNQAAEVVVSISKKTAKKASGTNSAVNASGEVAETDDADSGSSSDDNIPTQTDGNERAGGSTSSSTGNAREPAPADKEGEGATASTDVEVVQILPLKETYNVLSAVDNTKNIGFGIVLGPISLGARSASNDKQMYLVQDIDTVSFQRQGANSLSFGWTFRPVLGRPWLSPGTRRVYALLAIPRHLQNDGLKLSVTTGWRELDKSSGISKGELKYLSGPVNKKVRLWEKAVSGPKFAVLSENSTLRQALRKLGDETFEITVYGSRFTQDMELFLASTPVSSFRLDEVGMCNEEEELSGHLAHSQTVTFLAPKNLVDGTNYLFVGNDWGNDSIELSSAVEFPKPPAPKAACKVKITILSEGLVEKLESLVEGSDDKEKSGSKKALLKTPKTAIAITGEGLKGGFLVVAGQVYPYASAKSKSDTSLLFEVDAKGAVGNISFIDSSGKAHNSVTKLGTPSHKSN